MADPPNKRVGDYELLRHIGDGAQGKIFKSRCLVDTNDHVAKDEIVALKIIRRLGDDGKSEERFKREVNNFLTLSHPNIVDYRESFVVQDEWGEDINCLVMEFLEGEDLKERLDKHPKGLPWEFVKDLFEQCLAGLAYAGENGIIHRDLKPANIFLLSDGRVKIIDFGIAKKEDGTVTTTAGFKGTYDYMAPDFLTTGEDFRGDEISDVFSIGVCFCQAITGRLPYPSSRESGWVAYLNRWQKGDAKDIGISGGALRVLNERAMGLVRKCMRVDRAKRYTSFVDMLADLKKIERKSVKTNKHQYIFESYMGKGGFGEVFKAKRVADGKFFAVKHMFPSLDPERFRREARLLQKYPHPNMVAYEGFVKVDRLDGAEYYLILEFLEGMPRWGLRGRIKKEGALDVKEVVHLFCSYLTALDFLHTVQSRPILHRDITPANLYAPPYNKENPNDCVPKIFDMGIARSERTQTGGHVPGNPEYMAPEFVLESDFRGAPSSDIYCLGICLFESLTGKCVYPRLSRQTAEMWQSLRKRAEGKFDVNYDHQVFKDYPMLEKITKKAIDRNRKKRFKSAKEMLKALESVGHGGAEIEFAATDMDGEDESSSPTIFIPDVAYLAAAASGKKIRRTIKLKRFLSISAALLLVAAVGVGGRVLWERNVGGYSESDAIQASAPLPDFRPSSGYVALLRKRLAKAEAMQRRAPDDFQLLNIVDELALMWSLTPGKFDSAFIAKLNTGNVGAARDVLRQWRAVEDSIPYRNFTEVLHDRILLSMESRLKFLEKRIRIEAMPPSLSESYIKMLDAGIITAREERVTESLTDARQWWQNQQKILDKLALKLLPLLSDDFKLAILKGDLASAEALIADWTRILKTDGLGASVSRTARDKTSAEMSGALTELLKEKKKQFLVVCTEGDIVKVQRMSEWFSACARKMPNLMNIVAAEYGKILREIAVAQSGLVTRKIKALSVENTMAEFIAIIDLRDLWQKDWTDKQRKETTSVIIGKGVALTTKYTSISIAAYKADRFAEGDDAYLQLQTFAKKMPAEFKEVDLQKKLATVMTLREQTSKRAEDFRRISDELDKLVLASDQQKPAVWAKAIARWSSLKMLDATRKIVLDGRKWKSLDGKFVDSISQYVAKTIDQDQLKVVLNVLAMKESALILTDNSRKNLANMIALKNGVFNDRKKLSGIVASLKVDKPKTWAKAMTELEACRAMPSLSYDKNVWDLWKKAESACMLNMKNYLENAGSESDRKKRLLAVDSILQPAKNAKIFDTKQITMLEELVKQGLDELSQKQQAVLIAQRERKRIEKEQEVAELKKETDRKESIAKARQEASRKKQEELKKAALRAKLAAQQKKVEAERKRNAQKLELTRKKEAERKKQDADKKENNKVAQQEIEWQKKAAVERAALRAKLAAERKKGDVKPVPKKSIPPADAQKSQSPKVLALLAPIEVHLRASNPRAALKLLRSNFIKRCRKIDKKEDVDWIALRKWIEVIREEYPGLNVVGRNDLDLLDVDLEKYVANQIRKKKKR